MADFISLLKLMLLKVFSTITTIGYGYIYPVTNAGRMLSIFISLFGIPFTIVVIKDMAYIIAKLMNYPCELLGNYISHESINVHCIFIFHSEILGSLPILYLDVHFPRFIFHGSTVAQNGAAFLSESDIFLQVTVAVMALVGWTCIGCFIVHFYIPNHDTSTTFYFIFNSLATIGVGDIEPGRGHFPNIFAI
ncbi:Ion channel [Necator americanus]|uniref:Ion channel n=1 Tax=Necator americanus TaxID=51031 RepID=W2SPF5_NECAM|nr:Ion channel [Necator americanus]ETN71530.1 Ion channel [Necator americanus]